MKKYISILFILLIMFCSIGICNDENTDFKINKDFFGIKLGETKKNILNQIETKNINIKDDYKRRNAPISTVVISGPFDDTESISRISFDFLNLPEFGDPLFKIRIFFSDGESKDETLALYHDLSASLNHKFYRKSVLYPDGPNFTGPNERNVHQEQRFDALICKSCNALLPPQKSKCSSLNCKKRNSFEKSFVEIVLTQLFLWDRNRVESDSGVHLSFQHRALTIMKIDLEKKNKFKRFDKKFY